MGTKDRERKPAKRKAAHTLKEKRAAKKAKREGDTKPQLPHS